MKSRLPWLVPATVVAALAVLCHASRYVPTGPAAGEQLDGPPARPAVGRSTLRLATLNIHAGKGADGRQDLGRVAECLEGFDFIALNEVRGAGRWAAEDQARTLGERLHMASLFAPSVRRWYRLESGNGLLSSLPVASWQRIALERRYDASYRNAVLVELRPGGPRHREQTVRVLLTHVNRRHDAERRLQLRAVVGLFLALEPPAVLMGDLNSTPDDPQIRRLLSRRDVEDSVGAVPRAEAPPDRVDWIIVRGLRPVDAGVRDRGASDHPLFWAELELPPEPPAEEQRISCRGGEKLQ